MDINLARTFLSVAESGSFIEAARKLNLTQSTVSSRIKSLEDLLGRPLFERSALGAALTVAGQQFQKHAVAMLRVWQQARLDVGLADEHGWHLAVGAHMTLWDGLLLKWLANVRGQLHGMSVSAVMVPSMQLKQRLLEGALDLAIMYRPGQTPGLEAEHLFDDEFVLVTSAPAGSRMTSVDYVHIDWGADVQVDHRTSGNGPARPALSLDLGTVGLNYLLETQASGYFPHRLVRPYLSRGRLRIPARSRRYTFPVYVVFPEAFDEEAYEPLLDSLRRQVSRLR